MSQKKCNNLTLCLLTFINKVLLRQTVLFCLLIILSGSCTAKAELSTTVATIV